MEIGLALVILLLSGVLVYTIRRGRVKESALLKKVSDLESTVESVKKRHLTASGGLSRSDQIRMLDVIAKLDSAESDSEMTTLRIADAKREAIKIMKTRRNA